MRSVHLPETLEHLQRVTLKPESFSQASNLSNQKKITEALLNLFLVLPSVVGMDSKSAYSSSPPPANASIVEPAAPVVLAQDNSSHESPSASPSSGLSAWANIKLPQALASVQDTSQAGNTMRSTFARLASGFGLHLPAKDLGQNGNAENISTAAQSSVFESIAKGLVDSSISTVKAVQLKARHAVSQNKRRYQEGGFDLDMTYITENVIAMGFPAGDMSSGFFGYVEGLYRNHMEEVIKFFETHHKGKYKVYNLCSERLYDASLFEGKVGSFPFDDHNCPPLQLITSFCQSAYSWLKEDILNVVVVHCKAGMARTGLMISSLLLFLKLFPTAEECINYYNQKRCVDGRALILPSQIRYVKYFERLLTYFNGEIQPGRRCMLRGFRVHKCPYWIRPSITISDHNGIRFSTKKHPKTKDLMPEDFWIRPPKKGFVIFALPGEPGMTELMGDFKIHFQDRQGDFYCWLNTTMIENRIILNPSDLDGFDERKLPSPGFQIEIVMVDYDGTTPTRSKTGNAKTESDVKPVKASAAADGVATSKQNKISGNHDNDDVFSDSEGEETPSSNSRQTKAAPRKTGPKSEQVLTSTRRTKPLTLERKLSEASPSNEMKRDGVERSASGVILDTDVSDIKAIAADASVFSFGDEEDYESE